MAANNIKEGSLTVISKHDVEKLLTMKDCIAVLEEAFKALGDKEKVRAIQPLRTGMRLPGEDLALFISKPAYLDISGKAVFGMKALGIFARNMSIPNKDSHYGTVLLFESEYGAPFALIEAGSITGIRTAAASAVATKLLARDVENMELCIMGAGLEARTHIDAMLAVRKIAKVNIWNRTHSKAQTLAENMKQIYKGIEFSAVESAEDAVKNADIICTCTMAKEPVLKGAWLKPGCHINAIGASTPQQRELDTECVVKSRLYADKLESLENEPGDYLTPLKEGKITRKHIVGELSDLIWKRIEARRNDQEITLFKSLGLAIEDMASGYLVYEKAVAQGLGSVVPNFF
jgi:alanine dehydrogenase